jgi:osmotically-inducible protein OsmY
MKTNEDLQKDVQNAIKWEPLLNAAEIGVTAQDGIITLSGTVNSYPKKMEAENAAKRVAGVKAVVEAIKVQFSENHTQKNDSEIAREVLNAFEWNGDVPNAKIKVKVENGVVTLEGELPWNYQKEAILRLVKNLMGVTGVNNHITIKSDMHADIERKDIESALRRNWAIDDDDINVSVIGHMVTLTGTVQSWYQKDEAGRIAWSAPGVWMVENELLVEYEVALYGTEAMSNSEEFSS